MHIKRCINLKNNKDLPKRGEDDYNRAYNYDMIWDVIIHNINDMSYHVGLDMCGDETSWGCQGWVESNSVPTFKISNKPGGIKGGKIVMVTDVDCVLPRSYVNYHRINNHPENFEAQVPNKVCTIIEKMEDMVVGYPTNMGVKKIYDNQPLICWGN